MWKNSIKIAFVYIGLIIGAGFASGREIVVFFNKYGERAYIGVVFAALLFIANLYIIISKVHKEGIKSFDEFLNSVVGKWGICVNIFMILFMFSGFCVMYAGCGELAQQMLNVDKLWGIITLMCICFFVFLFDIKGIVSFNSVLVPFMVTGILYVSINGILFKDMSVFNLYEKVQQNFLTAAFCYVSYNTITAPAVLVPLHSYVNKKSAQRAAIAGGGILGIIIFIVWLVSDIYFDKLSDVEMPMFWLATQQGEIIKLIYGIILFLSIATTAVSNGFGILSQINRRTEKGKWKYAFALCVLAIPLSLLKFSVLVVKLYWFFGVVGIIWMINLTVDYFKSSDFRNVRRASSDN